MPKKGLLKPTQAQCQKKSCTLREQNSSSEFSKPDLRSHKNVASAGKDFGKCKKHGERDHVKYCKKCQAAVCSVCIQKSHGKHPLEDLTIIFEFEKGQLLTDIDVLQSKSGDECASNMDKLRINRNEYNKAVKMIELNMRKQAKAIKATTDQALKENLKILRQCRKDDKEIFDNEEEKILTKRNSIDMTVKQYTKTLHVKDKTDLIKFMKTRPKQQHLKECPSLLTGLSPPKYNPGKVNSELIRTMSGKIKQSRKVPKQQSPHIRVTSFVSCFSCDLEKLGTACTVRDKKIWVTFGTSPFLFLVGSDGKVLKKFKTGIGITDLKVRQSGKLIFCNKKEKCLQTFNPKGKIRNLVDTENWTPQGMCITKGNDYVVSMYQVEDFKWKGRIVKYSQTGEQLMEVTDDEDIELSHPYFLAENQNGDIWVTDRAKRDPKVVVVDKTGKYRFTYRSKRNEVTGKYVPRGICCDKSGNMLIANTDNHSIEIIDKDGQFVSLLIHRAHEIQFPYTLSIDSEDKLWIGEYESANIKIIKYSV